MAAGTINAVVGSGTLVTFPTLLACGLPAVTANVSNTVGLVPGSLSAAIGYRAELAGQRSRVLRLASASVLGAVVGALLLLVLPSSAFDAIVPVLIALGVLLVVFGPAYGHGRRAGSARCSTSRSCADDAPRYAHTRPYRGDAVIAGAADDRQDSPDLRRHHGHRP